jgi:class 3 adenylate cyclase
VRYVVAQYQKTARTAVELWGGHVAKELGDGLLVYFGWPDAREDDPERAIRAGRPCAFPRVRAARRVRRSASIVATASPVSVAQRTTSREDRKK